MTHHEARLSEGLAQNCVLLLEALLREEALHHLWRYGVPKATLLCGVLCLCVGGRVRGKAMVVVQWEEENSTQQYEKEKNK